MKEKSRAEYFRRRREVYGQFVVMIEKGKLEALDKKLATVGTTRAEWLRRKIDAELKGAEEA